MNFHFSLVYLIFFILHLEAVPQLIRSTPRQQTLSNSSKLVLFPGWACHLLPSATATGKQLHLCSCQPAGTAPLSITAALKRVSPIWQAARNELIQQEKKHKGLNCRQAAGVQIITRVWQTVGTAHAPKTTAQALILPLHICASVSHSPPTSAFWMHSRALQSLWVKIQTLSKEINGVTAHSAPAWSPLGTLSSFCSTGDRA